MNKSDKADEKLADEKPDTHLSLAKEEAAAHGISMSLEAKAAALELRKGEPTWQNSPLRLYIEGKGCDGFYYGVAFDEVLEGDHIFTQLHEESARLDLVVDRESLEFVEGSHIVWVDDERGRGFLVENPNHRKFRGKFYKRKSWQEKLQERLQGETGEQKDAASAAHDSSVSSSD